MAILNKIFILSMALLLTGCYEDIDLKPDGKPVLCINSLITAGKPIKADISHTWFYSDRESTNNHKVDDATLKIYANGSLVNDKYRAKEGDHIRLVAESATYGTAEAEVTVPVSVPFEKVTFEPTLNSSYFTSPDPYSVKTNLPAYIGFDAKVELTIDDQLPEINYYELSFENYSYRGNLSRGLVNYDVEPIFKEHIGILESLLGAESNGSTFFTDRQFANDSYTIHLNFTDFLYIAHDWRIWNEVLDDCGLKVTLKYMSESYYNWVNYSWQISDGFLNDFSSIGLGDPTWGYSNVSTGAGVVAACSIITYDLSFAGFIKKVIEEGTQN